MIISMVEDQKSKEITEENIKTSNHKLNMYLNRFKF